MDKYKNRFYEMAEQLYDKVGTKVYPKTELDARVNTLDASVSSLVTKVGSMHDVKSVEYYDSDDAWAADAEHEGAVYYARKDKAASDGTIYGSGLYVIKKDSTTGDYLRVNMGSAVNRVVDSMSDVSAYINAPGQFVYDASTSKLYFGTSKNNGIVVGEDQSLLTRVYNLEFDVETLDDELGTARGEISDINSELDGMRDIKAVERFTSTSWSVDASHDGAVFYAKKDTSIDGKSYPSGLYMINKVSNGSTSYTYCKMHIASAINAIVDSSTEAKMTAISKGQMIYDKTAKELYISTGDGSIDSITKINNDAIYPIVIGKITGTSGSVSLEYKLGESTNSDVIPHTQYQVMCERISAGYYEIYLPTSWFNLAKDAYVDVTGYGIASGTNNNPIKGSLGGVASGTITVGSYTSSVWIIRLYLSDGEDRVDGSCIFKLYNTADYGKSGWKSYAKSY